MEEKEEEKHCYFCGVSSYEPFHSFKIIKRFSKKGEPKNYSLCNFCFSKFQILSQTTNSLTNNLMNDPYRKI